MANLQSVPKFVGRSFSGFVVATVGTAPGGRLSGWELTVNCQHSIFSFFPKKTSLSRFSRNFAT